MSTYLKHFTVVGDDPVQWGNDYKKWEDQMEEEGGQKPEDSTINVNSSVRPRSFQDVMKKLFSSHKFQILVVCLVIFDALLVLAELLLDLKIIHPDKHEIAPKVFHYMSLSIVTIFLVEVGFKIFVYRLEFCHHKFEVLDAIVVVVSFIIDVVLLFREHEFQAAGLLILLRLWRVARIINDLPNVHSRSLLYKQINGARLLTFPELLESVPVAMLSLEGTSLDTGWGFWLRIP